MMILMTILCFVSDEWKKEPTLISYDDHQSPRFGRLPLFIRHFRRRCYGVSFVSSRREKLNEKPITSQTHISTSLVDCLG